MTPDLIRLVVACAPIAVVLILLVVRVAPSWAGSAGVLVAVAGAATIFPVSGATAAATAAQLGPTVIEVALILLGGIGLAHLMERSGAQDTIANWLERAESGADRLVPLLLLIFGMTPFMESVTGFGLGVVITAPLLIRRGLEPVRAVVVVQWLCLIGVNLALGPPLAGVLASGAVVAGLLAYTRITKGPLGGEMMIAIDPATFCPASAMSGLAPNPAAAVVTAAENMAAAPVFDPVR